MAYISQDPNQNEEANTTNVLAPTTAPTAQTSQPATSTTSQLSTSAPSAGYVSTGNPYGNYGTPSQPQVSAGTSASARKSTSGPSSGLQTNVQTYAQKNIQSSEKLGGAVAGKLQTTSDIARQNLQNVQTKFGQGVEAGSVANRETALGEAQKAFTEAATGAAPTRTWNEKAATMYAPTKTAEGIYSAEDQALMAANKARATFGDQSTKDFATQAEAQTAIDEYNRLNPGYYTYGDQEKLSTSEDRLSEILNAKYQGPQELSEIGGYGKAYTGYQDVGELQKQALSSGSKEELLKRTFATPTGEYTKGSRLLDELLLGQGKAAETLQTTAKSLGQAPSGKIGEEFTGKVKEARGQAIQRTQETEQLKESARKALSTTAEGRTGEVNQRINEVIKDWDKYPQYFRDKFKQELDTHNVAAEKKKEFDTIANQYGGYQNLTEKKNYNDQVYKDLDKIDEQKFSNAANIISEFKNYESQVASSGGNLATKQRLKDQMNQLASKYQDAQKYLEEVKPYLGGITFDLSSGSPITSPIELAQNLSKIKREVNSVNEGLSKLKPYEQYKDYDPNALDIKLSQLESEALGVQGGEGLYNILKEQGVEGLLKTKAADRNQLISQQEQSQLARLQSLAELSKDYGVMGSGVNVVNPYAQREQAGKQTALSALDLENFKRQMQGAEKTFRTEAAGSNISGTGTGTGSSSGAFSTKRASATKTLTQNLGDLLTQNKAYRNIYSDKGVDQDLLKKIISQAKGGETFNVGNVDPGVIGGVTDAVGGIGESLQNLLKPISGSSGTTNLAMLTSPLTASLALANMFGNVVGGSSAKAQAVADRAAQEAALANLQTNIQNKISSTGLKNQLSVGQNQARDLELFKLLGLLDTTNL